MLFSSKSEVLEVGKTLNFATEVKDIWWHLETFLFVTGYGGNGAGATGILQVEGRDAAKHPAEPQRASRQQRIIQKMSIVPLLRNPVLFRTNTTLMISRL